MNSINRRKTEQTNAANDEIKSLVADMTALYAHPDNANKFSWFIDVFVGASLLHPNDLLRAIEVVNKFNQRLEEPLTKHEQDLLLKRLERRLCDEF